MPLVNYSTRQLSTQQYYNSLGPRVLIMEEHWRRAEQHNLHLEAMARESMTVLSWIRSPSSKIQPPSPYHAIMLYPFGISGDPQIMHQLHRAGPVESQIAFAINALLGNSSSKP